MNYIDYLPYEMLFKIFSHLPFNSKLSISEVSTKYNQIILTIFENDQNIRNLRKYKITHNKEYTVTIGNILNVEINIKSPLRLRLLLKSKIDNEAIDILSKAFDNSLKFPLNMPKLRILNEAGAKCSFDIAKDFFENLTVNPTQEDTENVIEITNIIEKQGFKCTLSIGRIEDINPILQNILDLRLNEILNDVSDEELMLAQRINL